MTHTDYKSLERLVSDLSRKVNQQNQEQMKVKCSGPGRMPTKRLVITTRKSPCGNGTNTYDNWEMRIHKRVFHVYCSQKNFKGLITTLDPPAGVMMEAEQIEEDED